VSTATKQDDAVTRHRGTDAALGLDEVRRVDVVVVGSGVSGSAAAMTAARRGAEVALLEKQPSFGGSAALSAGMFWTAPSVDAYRKRIPLGNVDLGSRLVGDYEKALAELRAAGVRVAAEPKRDIMTFGIGYSTDIHAILAWCRDQVTAAGGETTAGAAVTELIRDDGGAVTGVLVRIADGRRVRYEAAAVVLASGGFQGDRAELTRSIGPNAARLVLRSNPGSVGDGLRIARVAGTGGTTAMSTFYGHLLPYPVDSFETAHYLPYSQYYSGSTVLVNLHGKRFADETDGDELLNQAVTFQPQARGILIFDEFVRSTEVLEEPFPGLGSIDRLGIAIEAGGQHAVAQTLPELVDLVAGWALTAISSPHPGPLCGSRRPGRRHGRGRSGVRLCAGAAGRPLLRTHGPALHHVHLRRDPHQREGRGSGPRRRGGSRFVRSRCGHWRAVQLRLRRRPGAGLHHRPLGR
jgi:glycine/D-amino acid oxidase-like deaminating enzyme